MDATRHDSAESNQMKKVLAVGAASVMPFLAFAQTRVSSIWDIFSMINRVLNILVPLFIAIAVVYFIWEVFQYTIAADEEKKKLAKVQMIYGIIGIFVMVSVWGLVNILQGTFGTAGVAPGNVNNLLPNF